jgi:hypothetical protein
MSTDAIRQRLHAVTNKTPSEWITRERPKIDRIAVPWLIVRFIDEKAVFHFVPSERVRDDAKAKGAIPFDIPDERFSHRGELCSFDIMLDEFSLHDSALRDLAVIVRGADTGRPELAPQAPGLLAISLGLSRLFPNDHEMLRHGLIVYDSLYAWCREARGETHGWPPKRDP